MTTFQARNSRKALILLFCISILLAKTANSTVVGSNLRLAEIRTVTAASTQTHTESGLGSLESAERAMLGNSHAATFSLPSLTILAFSQEWSAVFPIIGLIAAVAVTQLLRRRRIAQLRSSSSAGQ